MSIVLQDGSCGDNTDISVIVHTYIFMNGKVGKYQCKYVHELHMVNNYVTTYVSMLILQKCK